MLLGKVLNLKTLKVISKLTLIFLTCSFIKFKLYFGLINQYQRGFTMEVRKKPINFVAKQLQSKRYHVKKQDNKKAYKRDRMKQEFRQELKDIAGKEININCFLKAVA